MCVSVVNRKVIFKKIKMARKMDAGADDKPGYFLHGLMSN
jgi:hypothetical protein